VHEPEVQEHRGQQRDERGQRAGERGRHETPGELEGTRRLVREQQVLPGVDRDADDDEADGDDRTPRGRVVVLERQHHH
jgi:hypothetical protein